jgi:hypothetical protein
MGQRSSVRALLAEFPSYHRQARPSTTRGLSVGQCASLFAMRSRPDLREGLRRSGEGDEYQTSALRATISLATGIHRAADWVDSPRVCGSYHRLRRRLSASNALDLFCLLPWVANSLIARQGCPTGPENTAFQIRRGGRDSRSRWTPPSLRAPRRLTARFERTGPSSDGCPSRQVNSRPVRIPNSLMTGGSHLAPAFGCLIEFL